MADETLSPIVRPPVTFLPLLLPEFLPSGCASSRKTVLSCHAQFSEAMCGPPGCNRRTVTSLVIEGEEPIGIGKGYSGLRHSSCDFGAAASAGRFNTSRQSGGGAGDNSRSTNSLSFSLMLPKASCSCLLERLGRKVMVSRIPKWLDNPRYCQGCSRGKALWGCETKFFQLGERTRAAVKAELCSAEDATARPPLISRARLLVQLWRQTSSHGIPRKSGIWRMSVPNPRRRG